jgi:hypothetical protein
MDEIVQQENEDKIEKVAPIGWRTCSACELPKELNGKRFPKIKGSDDFSPVCKSCTKALMQKKKLERLEANACGDFLKKSSRGGSEIPHTSEMLESIMHLLGGSHGFASALISQYHAAPAGGRIRTQILELVSKLTVKVAESGATRAPIALMSDGELEAELNKRIEESVINYNGNRLLGVKTVEETATVERIG